MNIVTGNLWDYRHIGPVCVTTNGIVKHNGELVMGAGVALQAKQLYPDLPLKLGRGVRTYGNVVLYCQDENVISFPTKHHYKDPSDINLIETSCRQLTALADQFDLKPIFLPKPGCNNGQLDWNQVQPIISPILDDRFILVLL